MNQTASGAVLRMPVQSHCGAGGRKIPQGGARRLFLAHSGSVSGRPAGPLTEVNLPQTALGGDAQFDNLDIVHLLTL
jgi:hypothetical protein